MITIDAKKYIDKLLSTPKGTKSAVDVAEEAKKKKLKAKEDRISSLLFTEDSFV